MSRLKDLIYDKSDIIVALVIIAIAGLIVFSRIDAILSYPETFAADSPATTETAITPEDSQATEGAADGTSDGTSDDDADGTSDGDAVGDADVADEPVEMLAVYINYGESLQTIADKFVLVELVSTSEEFLSAIEDAGAATEIKSGNFIIPSDATMEEVIEIITQPGL